MIGEIQNSRERLLKQIEDERRQVRELTEKNIQLEQVRYRLKSALEDAHAEIERLRDDDESPAS